MGDLSSQLLQYLVAPLIVGGSVALISNLYITKKVKAFEQKLNLIEKYDLGLRDKRIEAYKELWKCMKPLSLKSKVKLSVGDLISLQDALTNWYYTINGGGLFLTESSQKRYDFFIEQLQRAIKNNGQESDIKKIKALASSLRTNLCKDIGTREESYLPSVYGDLKIKPGEPEDHNNNRIIKFFITYYGNKSIRFSQDDLIFTIQNLNYDDGDNNNKDDEYVRQSKYELREPNRFKDAGTREDSDFLYFNKCELKPREQIIYEWIRDKSDENYYLVKIKIKDISAECLYTDSKT
jgi:hypothetical protein